MKKQRKINRLNLAKRASIIVEALILTRNISDEDVERWLQESIDGITKVGTLA